MLIVLSCGHTDFSFWGSYARCTLPDCEPILIHRVRCSCCLVTHAILPVFLLGQVRYTSQTLVPYIKETLEKSLLPVQGWQQRISNGPADVKTLYRWFGRVEYRLRNLHSFLKDELLSITPAIDLSGLEKIILNARTEWSASSTKQASSSSMPACPQEMFDFVTLCQISFWLCENLLAVSGELLPEHSKLEALTFLNYFCWQKTGAALCSPIPKNPP